MRAFATAVATLSLATPAIAVDVTGCGSSCARDRRGRAERHRLFGRLSAVLGRERAIVRRRPRMHERRVRRPRARRSRDGRPERAHADQRRNALRLQPLCRPRSGHDHREPRISSAGNVRVAGSITIDGAQFGIDALGKARVSDVDISNSQYDGISAASVRALNVESSERAVRHSVIRPSSPQRRERHDEQQPDGRPGVPRSPGTQSRRDGECVDRGRRGGERDAPPRFDHHPASLD